MGFGTEIFFILVLGLLILGPKRLQTVLGHVAQAKRRFDEARHGFEMEIETELEADHESALTKSLSNETKRAVRSRP